MGCGGMSIDSRYSVDGREVSRTKGEIGYNSISIESSTNTSLMETDAPLMETCLAEIGEHPRAQKICEEVVEREMRQRQYPSYRSPFYTVPYTVSPYDRRYYGR